MQATRILRARTPLIHFLGKRSVPESIDHTPRVHPASPATSLPSSFKQYREQFANQQGPLASRSVSSSSRVLFSPKPRDGEAFDRNELPKRFGRLIWTPEEMDAIDSAGASLYA
jgi:small subunit ribosomal protein YMR-31